MAGVDATDRSRLRPHHQRLSERPGVVVPDAAEQLSVGDTGRGEEAVVAANQVVGRQDGVEIVTGGQGRPTLVVVARPQAALELAAHALEGGSGDDSLGGAPDAE